MILPPTVHSHLLSLPLECELDSLLMNSIQEKWWDVISEISLQKDLASVSSVLSSVACSSGRQLPRRELPYREAHVARNSGQKAVKASGLPIATWVSLKVDHLLVKLWYDNSPAWPLPWVQPYERPQAKGIQLNCIWIPDPQKTVR